MKDNTSFFWISPIVGGQQWDREHVFEQLFSWLNKLSLVRVNYTIHHCTFIATKINKSNKPKTHHLIISVSPCMTGEKTNQPRPLLRWMGMTRPHDRIGIKDSSPTYIFCRKKDRASEVPSPPPSLPLGDTENSVAGGSNPNIMKGCVDWVRGHDLCGRPQETGNGEGGGGGGCGVRLQSWRH